MNFLVLLTIMSELIFYYKNQNIFEIFNDCLKLLIYFELSIRHCRIKNKVERQKTHLFFKLFLTGVIQTFVTFIVRIDPSQNYNCSKLFDLLIELKFFENVLLANFKRHYKRQTVRFKKSDLNSHIQTVRFQTVDPSSYIYLNLNLLFLNSMETKSATTDFPEILFDPDNELCSRQGHELDEVGQRFDFKCKDKHSTNGKTNQMC